MFLTQRRWRMFVVEGAFDLLVLTYLAGVQVVLPFIQEEFSADPAFAAWVLIGFSLGTASAILPAAFLGNSIGRKPVVLVGLSMEATAMVIAFLAQDLLTVVLVQVLAGVGNALRATSMMAMVQGSFPPQERGKSLGIITAIHGLGFLMATPIAGTVADLFGWRYVFLMNLPVFLFAIAGVLLVFRDLPGQRTRRAPLWRFDYAGTVAMAMGFTALVLALQGLRQSNDLVRVAGLLALALVALAGFALIERRSSYPVVDFTLFKDRVFALGSSLSLLFAIMNGTVLFLFPFYLIQGLGWSGADAGAALIAFNIGRPAISPISGVLADRLGSRRILTAAVVVTLAGGVIGALLGSSPPTLLIVIALLLIGVGFGLFQAPNQRQVYVAVPQQKMSMAPGMVLLSGHGGRVIGTTIAATVLSGLSGTIGITGAFAVSIGLLTTLFAVGTLALFTTLGRSAAGKQEQATVESAARQQ